jgi:hypothetical protein
LRFALSSGKLAGVSAPFLNVPNKGLVRSYCSEGLPRRWYSPESAEALVKRKSVIAVRDRRGVIISIHFYGESRLPIKNRLKAGTRYSYQEMVGEGRRRWNHSRLNQPDQRKLDGFASLPAAEYSRAYRILESEPFRAVQISISASGIKDKARSGSSAAIAGRAKA